MTSPFDYSGPSKIIANDPSMWATRTATVKRGGPESVTGISKSNDERIAKQKAAILRDNRASHFSIHVVGQAEGQEHRDRTAAIEGRRNDRRSS